jgi:SAM-dependent methyltransferase
MRLTGTPRSSRERWDRRWGGEERVHASTAASRFLVAEGAGLRPGTALDLGCGAGRNAVWLAEQGWRVTAVDFSGVALRMARDLAGQRRVEVDWREADLLAWTPPARAFDLVCVLYLQLPAAERRTVLAGAAGAVREGGTLLVVGHDLLKLADGWGGPTQPDVLFTPGDVVAEIGDLRIEKAQRVHRPVEDEAASRPAIDALVRARRPATS